MFKSLGSDLLMYLKEVSYAHLGRVHTWRLFWLEKVDKSAFLVK